MKSIKKVGITTLKSVIGSIVDSLKANVDETTNAPSIRAVKEDLKVASAERADYLSNPKNIQLKGAISGNVDFDGSKDIIITTTQENIVILEGELTVPAVTNKNPNPYGSIDISLPEGYTLDNCCIISLMSKRVDSNIWSTYISLNNYIPELTSGVELIGQLYQNSGYKLSVSIANSKEDRIERKYNFRAVLMKVV